MLHRTLATPHLDGIAPVTGTTFMEGLLDRKSEYQAALQQNIRAKGRALPPRRWAGNWYEDSGIRLHHASTRRGHISEILATGRTHSRLEELLI